MVPVIGCYVQYYYGYYQLPPLHLHTVPYSIHHYSFKHSFMSAFTCIYHPGLVYATHYMDMRCNTSAKLLVHTCTQLFPFPSTFYIQYSYTYPTCISIITANIALPKVLTKRVNSMHRTKCPYSTTLSQSTRIHASHTAEYPNHYSSAAGLTMALDDKY